MEYLSFKSQIENTFSNVRRFSYNEKRTNIDSFLDVILDFKERLRDKTEHVYELSEEIEKLTWFNNLDEDCLMLLNDLISSAKDLRSVLIRYYVTMNERIKIKDIVKSEIEDFKNAIDELTESYEDLESVFFFLPKTPDFVETTKQLSLI